MAENSDYKDGQMKIDDQTDTWSLFMDATKFGGLFCVGLTFILVGVLSMGLPWLGVLIGVLIFTNGLGAIFETPTKTLIWSSIILAFIAFFVSFIQ